MISAYIPAGRECTVCQVWQQLEFFAPAKGCKFDRRPDCKACARAKYQRNPRPRQNSAMKALYGVGIAWREARLAEQGGMCPICKTTDPPRGWHIDHDHRCCPGKKSCGKCLRGVLCGACNPGLGHFDDNPVFLESAATYLRSF